MNRVKRRILFAALVFTFVFGANIAHGQITPSADSYTNTAAPTTNYGANGQLDVESASQTTYIQFNLSSIPSTYTSADITKATLKVYVETVTEAGSFNVDYVIGAWSESTITHNLAPALGTTIAAGVPLVVADKNQYILIDITPAVQAWLSGTANDGIALVGNSPLNASIDSKEAILTSHSPELDIVFAGGITGITTESGSGLTGGGTTGTLNLSLAPCTVAGQVLGWNGTAWMCSSAGTGTITSVTGTAGGGISAVTSGGAVALSLTNPGPFASLAANTFSGNQTVNGNVTGINLTASGSVAGGVVNATTSFDIGGTPFAFGSANFGAVFLGYAGNFPSFSTT